MASDLAGISAEDDNMGAKKRKCFIDPVKCQEVE